MFILILLLFLAAAMHGSYGIKPASSGTLFYQNSQAIHRLFVDFYQNSDIDQSYVEVV